MNDKPQAIQIPFYLRWVFTTSIGYALGFLLGFVLGHFLLGNVMIGVGIGTGVGLAQWLTLRKIAPVSPWWIASSVVGLTVALSLHVTITQLFAIPSDLGWPLGVFGWVLALTGAGTLTGYLQSRHLAGRSKGTGWWILASTIAWPLSVLGLAIPADMSGDYSGIWLPVLFLRNGILAPAVAGLLLGLVTGGSLYRDCLQETT